MAEARIPRDILRDMLAEVRLTAAEVDERFARATDPEHWANLCPTLRIENAALIETEGDLACRELSTQVDRNGWFKSEPFFAHTTITRLRVAVEVLIREGWPPVFAFLFDDVWRLTRHEKIVAVASTIMKADVVQLPFLWCHYVAAKNGAAGWPPHEDKAEKGGAITVWIPLTNATLNNGCMSFLPRGAVGDDVQRRFLAQEPLTSAEILRLVQAAHAVPADAGSVLGWTDSTIHWGGRCVDPPPNAPRMSVAVSFAPRPADGSTMPASWRGFIEAAGTTPSFRERLRMVGEALSRYLASEPLMSRWEPLARKLSTL